MTDRCTRPPKDWECTRTPEHTGPCAAVPVLTLKDGTVVPLHDGDYFYRPQKLDYTAPFRRPALQPVGHWRWGVILRLGSFWVGVHYSKKNRRWCVNPVPCLTLWFSAPGGEVPDGPDFDSQLQINHPLTLFP